MRKGKKIKLIIYSVLLIVIIVLIFSSCLKSKAVTPEYKSELSNNRASVSYFSAPKYTGTDILELIDVYYTHTTQSGPLTLHHSIGIKFYLYNGAYYIYELFIDGQTTNKYITTNDIIGVVANNNNNNFDMSFYRLANNNFNEFIAILNFDTSGENMTILFNPSNINRDYNNSALFIYDYIRTANNDLSYTYLTQIWGQINHSYVEQYNKGYDVGYNDGYDAGQEGETALTPAFNVLTNIFTGLGAIMAVELVPHVPLGLFVLVPLFFSVLGLIFFVWRKD